MAGVEKQPELHYYTRMITLMFWFLWDIISPWCSLFSQTTKHLLQSCPLYELLRKEIWPDYTPVARKRYGSLGDLRCTATLIEETEFPPDERVLFSVKSVSLWVFSNIRQQLPINSEISQHWEGEVTEQLSTVYALETLNRFHTFPLDQKKHCLDHCSLM